MIPNLNPLPKKKITLPNGDYIKIYSKKEYVEDGLFVMVNYRMTYNKSGKILSVITNGHWETRRFDEQNRIIYYENSRTGERKTCEYVYDETINEIVKVEHNF